MATLPTALVLAIQGSVVALGLALGLDADVADVLHLVSRPAKFGRAFLAICVVVPAAAAALVWLPPLIGPVKAGILLMALAPVPPIMPPKSLRLGAQRTYVYGLYVTFVVLTVITVPVTVQVLGRLFHVEARTPIPELARSLVVLVLAPVAAGMLARARWPQTARRLARPVDRISTLLLTAVAALVVLAAGRQMLELTGDGALLVMIAVAGIGVACGHWLGGPDPDNRPALASAAALRHPGVALMIAKANDFDRRVYAAILLFTVVGVAVVWIYRAVLSRRRGPPADSAR